MFLGKWILHTDSTGTIEIDSSGSGSATNIPVTIEVDNDYITAYSTTSNTNIPVTVSD